MKELKDEDIWLTATEIAKLKLKDCPKSRNTVHKWADIYNWERKERTGSGGGFFFSFLSLPDFAREEIKNNPTKWQQVCEWIENRGKFKPKPKLNKGQNKSQKTFLSAKEQRVIEDSSQRLIFERIGLGKSRENLAAGLGISLEELREYEYGEKPLNLLHLVKLQEIGFDAIFILFGKRATDKKEIRNEVNNNQGNVNINN